MSRIPLGRAHLLASSVIYELRNAGAAPDVLTPVGSLRRFSPDIGDVALFAAASGAGQQRLMRAFTTLPAVQNVAAISAASATVATSRGSVTLHVGEPEVAGSALVWLTGSVRHVSALAGLAEQRGMRFAAGSLTGAAGKKVRCETEEEFYASLGLPLIPPELRDGSDAIAAAREGRLPPLLSDLHMRGDLHMHSVWSDGRDTIETMVRASIAL